MRKIIIQGDDWGYSEEASAGIEYAYEHGILTETTIMTNLLDMKRKSQYSDRIAKLVNSSGLSKPKLGLGIHLNVTYGKPLSSKWPQNEFSRPFKGSRTDKEWIGSAWKEYFLHFSEDQVEAEYRKQIETGLDIFGNIDHIDSHHFSASYEPLTKVYKKLAKDYNLAIRTLAPLSEKAQYGGDFVVDKEEIQSLKQDGFRIADNYCLKYFTNEKDSIKALLNRFRDIPDNSSIEFMFHPAKGSNVDKWKLKDLEILTNEIIIKYMNSEDIQLITYAEI